jgi:hypothetical protein
MKKIQEIKDSLIEELKDLKNVLSITPLGRHYSKTNNNYSLVNDIDIHIYLEEKTERDCSKILKICNTIIQCKKNDTVFIKCGIIDGPFKPQENPNTPIFFFHLIIDDLKSLFNRTLTSYPTILSWSKYEPLFGLNYIKPHLFKCIEISDVLDSRFGVNSCIKFISDECVDMIFFNEKSEKFELIKINLKHYYFFYFLFYSTMQTVRNFMRLNRIDIEFKSEQEVLKILENYIENEIFIQLNQIVETMNKIRLSSFSQNNIDISYYKESTLKVLNFFKIKLSANICAV